MNAKAEQKLVQYLSEAHASELGLTQVLRAQIAMTPHGAYRTALDTHLTETTEHARRLEARLSELRRGFHPRELATAFAEGVIAQAVAVAKTPLDLLRGSGGEEKILKNAKDTCATEALEIATYIALERLAHDVGDAQTAKLAVSLRREEERMLGRVIDALPGLVAAVVDADVHGKPSYDPTQTGVADVARSAGSAAQDVLEAADGAAHDAQTAAADGVRGARVTVKRTTRRADARAHEGARKVKTQVRSRARQARKVPGVTRVEGEAKGAVASASDLPIANYESLTAAEINERLTTLSQVDLGKIDAYERRHDGRTTILNRVSALRADEPWPGYDELTVDDVRTAISGSDASRTRRVRSYERAHKNRAGVLN